MCFGVFLIWRLYTHTHLGMVRQAKLILALLPLQMRKTHSRQGRQFLPFFLYQFCHFFISFFFYPFLFLLIKHVNQETIFFFLKKEKNEEHIDVGRRFDQQLWSHSGGVGENFSNYYCIHKIIHTSVIKTLASEHARAQRLFYFLA